MKTCLTMTEEQYTRLYSHVFPNDLGEAVAFVLCGVTHGIRTRLLVHEVHLVPYEACSSRGPDHVTWPTEIAIPWLQAAQRRGLSVVKIHGHRGYAQFSSTDDHADTELFPGVYAWTDSGPHGSLILLDDGRLMGRIVTENGQFLSFEKVSVIGDEIRIFEADSTVAAVPAFGYRVAQTFGSGTFARLRKLRVAVVGCSGTGSPVIEQLARNCVGTLVLVDPDHVEEKNLNRILNSTLDDAEHRRPKVDVAKRSILAMGLGTEVETHQSSLFNPEVVRAISDCDVVFGCIDTVDGRFLLNKLATFYLLPYFDLGVKIEADGNGGVDQVCGSVHYLKPGGSSLLSRHLFTLEQVRAAGLLRADPAHYRDLLGRGYIRGVQEDRPAVVQLNSLIASLAVNEFLARLHPYRLDPNAEFAVTRISLSHSIYAHEPDGEPCAVLKRHLGRGDVSPLLEWPELVELPQ